MTIGTAALAYAAISYGVPSSVVADGQIAASKRYTYTATTMQPAREQGTVRLGSLTWRCKGSVCSITGPWPHPDIVACQKLARRIGPVRSFGRKGSHLGRAQLNQCNAGIVAATPPATKAPGVPLPPGAAQTGRPEVTRERTTVGPPHRTVTVRTGALTYWGRGAAGPPAPRAVTVRTGSLTYTGQGAAAAAGSPRASGSAVIRTGQLIYTGRGAAGPITPRAVTVRTGALTYTGRGAAR